jgi:hypothetical protein
MDSGSDTSPSLKACLSGRLRDVNNGSADGILIDAFRGSLCEPLGSTTT